MGDRLEYRGVVEWGFKAADVLELLRAAKTPARTSPFTDLKKARGVVWLDARLCAEVTYAEVVSGRLRASSWRALLTR